MHIFTSWVFFSSIPKNILQILKQFTVCNLQGRVSKFLEVYRILFFKKMSDTIEYSKEIALHIIHFPILEYNEAIYLGKHSLHYMNIFGSKSGYLNNSKNCKVFFIPPNFCYIWWCFPSSTAHLALSTLKNHQILQNFWRKWRKIFQLLLVFTSIT